jgi:hypothetical protein
MGNPAPTSSAPAEHSGATPSKKEAVIALLRREHGATLEALTTLTGWQAHSVRGFLIGALRKKLKLTISRTGSGNECTYHIQH